MILALEAVEALCSGPSFLMADTMGPLLDQDEEEALSPSSSLVGEVPASPLLSPSPDRTLVSPVSPPPGHPSPSLPSFGEAKAGSDVSALPWLAPGDLLHAHVEADPIQDDAFAGMDWMSEKIDLSDFDLESLMGSCSSDESPASPGDLLASLHCHMDLDLEPFGVAPPEVGPPEAELPAVPTAAVMKSEPCSPAPPPSPVFLESETDTKSPLAAILSDRELLPEEVFVKASSSPSGDSDSGIESSASSPHAKPYARPQLPSASSSLSPKSKVKSSSGAPKVVEKKLKKMEQNKTAATRYRQKKRVEQEQLNVEREALEARNRELAERADAISREIQYLKDLMEEVRKHHHGKTRAGAK